MAKAPMTGDHPSHLPSQASQGAASPSLGHMLPSCVLPESFAVVEIKFGCFRATPPARVMFLKMRSGNTPSQRHLRHLFVKSIPKFHLKPTESHPKSARG